MYDAPGGMCAQVFAAAAFMWATGERIAFCIARRHPPLHKAATALQVVSSSRDLKRALRCGGPLLGLRVARAQARQSPLRMHAILLSCSTLRVACL
jgi:hypothetical protein